MSKETYRRWIGPIVVLLAALLGAGLIRLGWIPNVVLRGSFFIDIAAILFYGGLLAAVIWGGVILLSQNAKRQVETALAEERTAQNLERQRFLRRLDHELKNPLTTIRLGIANLQQNAAPEEEMAGSLERVSHQAQRLQTLVENLRRLAEMDENSLDRTQVDLREVLEDARELACVSPECENRSVQISVQQVPWPLSNVYGDRDLLTLAFRNLIENALKFSGAQGRVEARASENGRTIQVEIDDNGRGIPAEDLPHIFDELYRGENARDMPGSGLGLAMVRRIIELHGGSVEVHSRAEQGTMVLVHLPISHT